MIKDPLRGGGPDTRQKVENPETGHAVARILGKPQQCQHVLDMGGIEEFEARRTSRMEYCGG